MRSRLRAIAVLSLAAWREGAGATRRSVFALASLVAIAFAGCGGGGTAPSATAGPAGTYASAHFVFEYTTLDAGSIAGIAGTLEAQYDRILSDLGVDRMPTVTVTLYLDHAAMVAATQAVAGFIPAAASGLVTSDTRIHLMSPNAPAWGPFDLMVSNLVHEFAHCVSLHLNPRIANNPRWLWESVAVYESGQSVDLRTVPYMTALTPPFATMSGFDNNRVYEVGYSIAEFVVARWGRRALVDLIAANGDTAAVLGLPLADFERDWFAFTRQRYGF
jgi:hypothetical protein